ncbi:MAG: cob(I)yrinic acid a,c-diamide adenosyltransferase [bacterium]|nr:cob(I)yrinic acid a,c-diamide adenosyltransferase [bacterium]
MKIYTRRGDRGQTDLFGGDRVDKDDLRVAAYGDVDELNACVGVAAAATSDDDLLAVLQRIQGSLFDLGSLLATPSAEHQRKSGLSRVDEKDVTQLESDIDRFEDEVPALKRFVLPGGTPAAAAFHHARTVCRRTERSAVALDRDQPLDPAIIQYLNRLSDLLFTLARVANARARVADVTWGGRER